MSLTELQHRLVAWHEARFPEAQLEHVALKLAEEAGEVCRAVNGAVGFNSATGGDDVAAEAADCIIALLVLMGRWLGDANDLLREVEMKLLVLETVGAHRASALE